MSGHTPGPWTVYEPTEGATYGITGEDGTAVVFWGETTNDGINKVEDARLIAAAPELLEALKLALKHTRDPFARSIATAAIDKANGGAS